jgi:hypothetical protein
MQVWTVPFLLAAMVVNPCEEVGVLRVHINLFVDSYPLERLATLFPQKRDRFATTMSAPAARDVTTPPEPALHDLTLAPGWRGAAA